MKGSTRAATAIAVGYLLGRRKKLRTAAVMAAATAVGGTAVGGIVMRRGMKLLGSTDALGKIAPQLNDIADTVRGDLLTAGKAAFATAASNRVDALTDSLHERAERVRNPGAAAAEGAERAQDTARGAGRAASSAGGRAASAASGTARRAAGRRGSRADADDEYEDYEQEEPEYGEADDNGTARDERDDYPADDEDSGARDERGQEAGRGRRTGSGRKAPASGRSAPRRSPVTRTGR